MSTTLRPDPRDTALSEALHAPGPPPELHAELQLFGQFVGSWDLDWSGRDTHGRPARKTGELHVGWVLGGRAVQDVWIVPRRGDPADGQPSGFHGTTIRFYDANTGSWHCTWIDPPNSRVRRFLAHSDGADISLTSDDGRPLLRWRFTDITATSFRWIGDISVVGDEWQFHQQMLATRRK